jgi:hypothetical protein
LLPEKFIEHFGARLRALAEREADLRSDDARFPLSLAEMLDVCRHDLGRLERFARTNLRLRQWLQADIRQED